MNSREHFKGAIFTALFAEAITALEEQGNFDTGRCIARVLTRSALATFGAALPDIIEPADHPHHRDFFHSYTLGAGTTALWIANRKNMNPEARFVVDSILLGYGTHLLQDSRTPRGLPLF